MNETQKLDMRLVRMSVVFLVTYGLLNLGYFLLPDGDLKKIHEWAILKPAAATLNGLFGASVNIIDNGLVSDGIYLAVVRGCDGAGVMFLLMAAITCFPTRVRFKVFGLLAGFLLVHGLNACRIIVLYLVFRDRRELFADLHNLYIPTGMLLVCSIAFLLWLQQAQGNRAQPL